MNNYMFIGCSSEYIPLANLLVQRINYLCYQSLLDRNQLPDSIKDQIKEILNNNSKEQKKLSSINELIEKLNENERKGIENNKIINCITWYEERFFNVYFLDHFSENILEKCDFSLFIISQDDILIKRNEPCCQVKTVSRDNVWFEAAMFIAKRGKERLLKSWCPIVSNTPAVSSIV